MQDIEAAIGEDDFLVVCPRILDGQQQLIEAQHATLRTFRTLDRPAQFRRTDGRRTQLADHNTGRQIGQRHGVRQLFTGRNGCGQGRNNGIASAGHVKHFTGTGRQVHGSETRAQQGHAMLATGHQQGTQVQIGHQLGAFGH